jgi:hypothetical protein
MRLGDFVCVALLASSCQRSHPTPKEAAMTAFPTVEGEYHMTKSWSITLPGEFKRRFENGSLVLWRPGVTLWTNIFRNDLGQPASERLAIFRRSASPDRFDVLEEEQDGVLRFAYRLNEASNDRRRPAFCSFAFGRSGHVQMSVYFDDERDLETARALWRSLRETADQLH